MAKKTGENLRKAAGNAKKAENAAKKNAEAAAAAEAAEAAAWEDGLKKLGKKKDDAQFKKDEAARKKAERDALLAAEEALMPSGKQRGAAKLAAKRTGKIDDFVDFDLSKPELTASGIDDALEALALTGRDSGVASKDIDRHPERRVKAAYAAFELRRMPELRKENPGLRLQQVKNLVYREFQKLDENPMNQDTNVLYNASSGDVERKKDEVRGRREKKFA